MCLKTNSLKFLDISNYLAPGFSYDQFLKAYECEQIKGFFPYQWLDCLDKLEETSLPPHAAFYSSLKNANITDEECQYCQKVCEDNEMSIFKDFLVWYNDLDIVPFLEAVKKTSQFWQKRKINMFKDGISVPGVTLKYLFYLSFLRNQTYFSLFDQADTVTCIISLKTTTPAVQVSVSTVTMKQAKQRSEKRRKARLLSRVKISLVMTRMPCISGR